MGKLCVFLVVLMSFTGCEDALEPDISGKEVVLVAPTNGVVTDDTVQRFAWEYIETSASYQLQVVAGRFDSIAALYTDTTTVSNVVRVALKKGKQYQWRVRALNGSYNSAYSAPYTLTIQ